ncbi:MAG: FMN-binding negative transcriptional regulator [Candidatus Elarobacter sp.]
MYVPPHFRIDDPAEIAAFMRSNAFATLVSVHEGAPFATHLPLLVDGEGASLTLAGHVARANPQWRSLADQESLALFTGPHAYVSPSWYGNAKSVPTWNYAAVHVYGRARLVADPAQVYDTLRRLTEREEGRSAKPWRIESLPDDYVGTMMEGIVAFTIVPSRVEGKYKLSQNRDRADRETVARELSASPSELARETAALMQAALRA